MVDPCKVLLRSKDGVELFTVSSSRDHIDLSTNNNNGGERNFLVKGGTSIQVYAPDGSCVYLLLSEFGVVKCSLDDDNTTTISRAGGDSVLFLQDTKAIQMMTISPLGNYLLTWERSYEHKPKNLRVWCAKTGTLVASFLQKGIRRDAWPYLQWTADEKYAFLMTTNEVRVYNGNDFAATQQQEASEIRFIDKLRLNGITSLSVPQTNGEATPVSYLFTSFCPKNKDKPPRASLHEYPPSNTAALSAPVYPALLSKSLFQAEEMTVNWSPKADAALITLQTSVDTSGQSYYGSATLYLLSKDSKEAVMVPLPQEGPVHDVKWMPNASKSSSFAVVAGKMPSMGSLHNGLTAEPTFLFGNAHRNTICWSDHGRFVCVAGFGNLAGGMSFWDRNKLKLIPPSGENKASCTVGYGWSPDSRLFIVSTTSPRMNVDNGAKLYRYNGEEGPETPWENTHYHPNRLLQASFVPAALHKYPDRPQSPNLREAVAAAATTSTTNNTAAAAHKNTSNINIPKKPAGRYLPPSARGRASGGSSLAERMKKAKDGNLRGAGKVKASTTPLIGASGKSVPGATNTEASAEKSKSALKREKAKAAKVKKAEEEAVLKRQAEEAATAAQEAAANDPVKRTKKLNKLLKKIEELKTKDPSTLNEDQLKKMDTEQDVREELQKLALT